MNTVFIQNNSNDNDDTHDDILSLGLVNVT